VTADTSAVVAGLSAWHEQHEAAAAALAAVAALPAHVVLEAYSVLTRLPAGLAVPPVVAASVLVRRFVEPPLRVDDAGRHAVVETLAGAGVFGGASYDGVVALEAKAHGRVLLTLDERAQSTYQRLGAAFRPITPA
jgi:predicted nucleic acid-binding protein